MAAAVEQPEESPLDDLFSYLVCSTVDTVVWDMTVESSRRKSDWRALASVLGFNGKQVQLMQQNRQPCKGRILVEVWEDLGKSSVRKLIYALKEARMEQCLRTIAQDPYLENVDFTAVLKEYEQLKADKLLRKQCFPLVSNDRFQNVFCPHVVMPSSFSPILTEDSVECENMNKSAPVNCSDVTVPSPAQELDENSVFISYCPESGIMHRKFNNQLRRFAEFIQSQGFTLHFEPNSQAEIRRYGGPVMWKEACIRRSKNIVVVCTSEYFKEDSKATLDVRVRRSVSKIEVESHLLRQLAYSPDNTRLIPVYLDAHKPSMHQIPPWLLPMWMHCWPSGQRDLDLCLHNLPRYVLPKVDPSKKKVIRPIVINFPDARRHNPEL